MLRRLVLTALSAVVLAGLVVHPAGAGQQAAQSRRWASIRLPGGAPTAASLRVHGNAPLVNWASAGTMGTAVAETGGAGFVKGRVVVPGGWKSTSALFDKIQTLNLATNAWTTDTANPIPGTNTNSPRADFAVCTDGNGKVHLLQGQTLDGMGNGLIFAAHFVYDPKAASGSRWTFLAYPQLANGSIYYSLGSGCVFIGGKLYLFGGLGIVDPPGTTGVIPQGLTWVYNPVTNTWTDTGKTMVQGRFWAGYTGNSTNAYVVGGTRNASNNASLSTAETFTPAGGWTSLATIPSTAAGRLAPGLAIRAGNLDVFGGGKGNSSIGFTLWSSTYGCALPSCTSWSDQSLNLTTARWFFGWASGKTATLPQTFVAAGGGGTGGTLASAERQP
jgi:hypothetical protein